MSLIDMVRFIFSGHTSWYAPGSDFGFSKLVKDPNAPNEDVILRVNADSDKDGYGAGNIYCGKDLGKYGGGCLFNGTYTYIQLPYVEMQSNATFEAWFKSVGRSVANRQYLFSGF